MDIVVHIERLVLDGVTVAPGDRPTLESAITAELSRLLAAGGLSPELHAGAALPSVRGGRVEAARGAHPNRLGQGIARAVYSGIGAPEPAADPGRKP